MDYQKFLQSVKTGVLDGDPSTIGILVALFIVLLTIVILVVKGSTNKRRGVLLVGLCDAGKTLIFSRLINGKFVQTHTSIKDNTGSYTLKGEKSGTSLQLLDLPGHERLRYQSLDQSKTLARGIIFVIDSLTIQKEIKDVAEWLYSLLTDRVVGQNAPPILVACNKSEQALAKGAKVIQTMLEKEMNTLRVTRSAALAGIEGTSNNNTYLGKRNKDLSFSDLKPFKVEFVECSARGSKDENQCDLKGVEDWLARIA